MKPALKYVKPILPLPEVLPARSRSKKKWAVEATPAMPGCPFTDVDGRKMGVPTDASELSEAIRAHELGHARFSPTGKRWTELREMYRADDEAMNAVEEARINSIIAQDANIPLDELVSPQIDGAAFTMALVKADAAKVMLQAVSALGSGRETLVLKALEEAKRKISDAEIEAGRGSDLDADMHYLADYALAAMETIRGKFAYNNNRHEDRYIGAFATMLRQQQKSAQQAMSSMHIAREKLRKRAKAEAKKALDAKRGSFSRTKTAPKRAGGKGVSTPGKGSTPIERTSRSRDRSGMRSDVRWSKMFRIAPKLVQRVADRGKWARKIRADEEGAVPRYIHRYASDGRIFTARRRAPGGTVLIDASSSMSLRPAQVKAIIDAAPGAQVAVYASDITGDTGELRIVAKHGRMAADSELTDEALLGNGVDGPALEWLIKQARPRIWVCDGIVTGVEDAEGSNLYEDVVRLVRRGHVENVATVGAALRLLKGKQ